MGFFLSAVKAYAAFNAQLGASVLGVGSELGLIPKEPPLPHLDPFYDQPLAKRLRSVSTLPHPPIILVSGNSGKPEFLANTVAELEKRGYDRRAIFPLRTFQYDNGPLYQYYGEDRLRSVRTPIEQIAKTYGAPFVISASMGVQDAIAAIQGGEHVDMLGSVHYNLGNPIRCRGFLGIAGVVSGGLDNARLGGFLFFPVVGTTNGNHPSSAFLARLRSRAIPADTVMSLTSSSDHFIGARANEVGRIPGETKSEHLSGYNHYGIVLDTAKLQVDMLERAGLRPKSTAAQDRVEAPSTKADAAISASAERPATIARDAQQATTNLGASLEQLATVRSKQR